MPNLLPLLIILKSDSINIENLGIKTSPRWLYCFPSAWNYIYIYIYIFEFSRYINELQFKKDLTLGFVNKFVNFTLHIVMLL